MKPCKPASVLINRHLAGWNIGDERSYEDERRMGRRDSNTERLPASCMTGESAPAAACQLDKHGACKATAGARKFRAGVPKSS